MVVRAVSPCSIFNSVSSPPLPSIPCHLCRLPTLQCRTITNFAFTFRNSHPDTLNFRGLIPTYSAQNLNHTVMDDLQNLRYPKKVRLSEKMGFTSNKPLLEDKLERRELKKGFLLEFKQDSDRLLLAVAQKPDGKKSWIVADQNGVTTSIKTQQITFIVPGVKNFDHTEICDFIQKAQDNLDPSLLEFAWIELLEKCKSVTVVELAQMIFGSTEPLESYCTHFLLSNDEFYFTVLESRGPCSVYCPRTVLQVEELKRNKLLKEAADKEFDEFVMLLKLAKSMSPSTKPSKSSWTTEHKIHKRIKSLEAYAIDACKNDDQKTAEMILKAVGLVKASSSAVDLLVDIGYFPVHVNLDLLKFDIHTHHSDEVVSAAESLLLESIDPDEADRIDLSHLKVYAIDVDEADELDDALSARRMEDGRIQVLIHVADPTSFVQPGSKIYREALRRGTSVFLPTATYPMFPEKLAMEGMSMKQGVKCRTVTVSVVLHSNGCIAEVSVENSIIKPTYMLTYHTATELLYLNLEEEAELKILEEAASLRFHWRRQQGAIDTATLEARIKVANPEDPEPPINLYVENQSEPAMRLVSEMMILCGEAIATFGSSNNIPLPFRGQPQSNIDISAFSHLPEGPVRSSAVVRVMRAAQMDYRKPIRHGVLGIPGYVQFTSPIRRYMDLLAHYQVKAFLRGESPTFSSGQLEGMGSIVNVNTRIVKKVCNNSLRYWVLEYLRRQPKDAKFHALVLRFIKDRTAALLIIEVFKLLHGFLSGSKLVMKW
ncbi:ribonuclease II, chloroplastic/mitochondrial-like isoform X2 [Impatiens glandulifera]|uniref:ribonuclease II, chloroplastic/mitochondrial-like isoform X2 n=1 Tax=Impatiens glandulifera TaxID=253017 RepID=UPI001FB04ED6|nr:ribonuclease II, chloroplastic/mitochondrial-like isoform X2 [Impatiens glandulifera]